MTAPEVRWLAEGAAAGMAVLSAAWLLGIRAEEQWLLVQWRKVNDQWRKIGDGWRELENGYRDLKASQEALKASWEEFKASWEELTAQQAAMRRLLQRAQETRPSTASLQRIRGMADAVVRILEDTRQAPPDAPEDIE